MIKIVNQNIYNLIKYAFFGKKADITCDLQLVYNELKPHGVASLVSDVIKDLPLDDALKHEWTSHSVRQAYIYMFVVSEQEKLMKLLDGEDIPFVIIKGCAAAKYYPKPIYRSMGDIDILVKLDDFDRACALFDKSGFKLLNTITPYERHARYEKNGIVYELHRFFASMNNVKAAEVLDTVVMNGMDKRIICETEGKKFPMLPDFENGFVLLQHVNQHLENGLGLRQILDWMVYVNTYLDDDKWIEFEKIADKIGLKKLALVMTRMCQLYLGLPERITWCIGADENLCHELMQYIMKYSSLKTMQAGNNDHIVKIFSKRMSMVEWFKFLQRNGAVHWRYAKYPVFKSFAWLYQLIRYAFKGLTRKGTISSFVSVKKEGKKQRKMFNSLGTKSNSKGLTIKQKDGFVLIKKK